IRKSLPVEGRICNFLFSTNVILHLIGCHVFLSLTFDCVVDSNRLLA
ncbi:unnamed protein product, partial [Musa acuminata subsp. burmannicoides]|uniref:(wild Malaysian banana) hypothetical protein n=1 Tax=Musa acuminata subsp. malaccensis TaxID=214687 RepID=A0A804K8D5_MUSAM